MELRPPLGRFLEWPLLSDGLSKTKPGIQVDRFHRKLSHHSGRVNKIFWVPKKLLIIQAFQLIFAQQDYGQAMGTPTPTQGMSRFVERIP